MRIEIKSDKVQEISGIAKLSQKPYLIRKQSGYAYVVDEAGQPQPYPESIDINLDREQPAYPPGVYLVLDSSFYVGDFKSLTIGKLRLQSIEAAKAAHLAASGGTSVPKAA